MKTIGENTCHKIPMYICNLLITPVTDGISLIRNGLDGCTVMHSTVSQEI